MASDERGRRRQRVRTHHPRTRDEGRVTVAARPTAAGPVPGPAPSRALPASNRARLALAGLDGVLAPRAPTTLPHAAALTHLFVEPLPHVPTHVGVSELSPRLDATAASAPDGVAFAAAAPSIAQVAHEVTHVLQHRLPRRADGSPAGAEAEAAEAGRRAAAGQPIPRVVHPAAAAVQLDGEIKRLDPFAEARALRSALAGHADDVVRILERNAAPADMYALHQAYGPEMTADIRAELTRGWSWAEDSRWARARAFLGDQLPLHLRISTRGSDRAGIFRDLARLPDEQALALYQEDVDGFHFISLEPEPLPFDVPAAPTTRAEVVAALRGALDEADYLAALELLLAKAAHAAANQPATDADLVPGTLRAPFAGPPPHRFLELARLDEPGETTMVVMDAVRYAAAELVLEQLRLADAADWDVDPAARARALSAAVGLDDDQRRLVLDRLPTVVVHNLDGTLREVLTAPDVASGAATAVMASLSRAYLVGGVADPDAVDHAIAVAAGQLASARARRDQLSAGAGVGPPTQATAQATEEVRRLEELVLGPEVQVALSLDPARAAARLQALGADAATVGAAQLRMTSPADFEDFLRVVRAMPPAVRFAAIDRADLWDDLERLTVDQREVVAAYVMVGQPARRELALLDGWDAQAGTDDRGPDLDAALPTTATDAAPWPQLLEAEAGLAPSLTLAIHGLAVGDPAATIAADECVRAMASGHPAAALRRLEHLDEGTRLAALRHPRLRAQIDGLDDSWLREAFRDAELFPQVGLGVYAMRTNDTEASFEWLALRVAELGGQPRMRRGYVLTHRRERDPTLTLTPDEQVALDDYQLIMRQADDRHISGWRDREHLAQIVLGQPQLVTSAEAALDPNLEADFMSQRLAARAAPRGTGELQDGFYDSGPAVDEAVAAFRVRYRDLRAAGIDAGELAQLAELYHQAMRALDQYRADDESFAASAAKVVAAVVAVVVVTVASGGTLGLPAVAALAGLSAGAAAAATGAYFRIESTARQVTVDAGTGLVEGVAAACGQALAARLVQGAAAGLGAGRAAATIGGDAVQRSVGIGATIAEGAIDGAIGGAAGELFATAVDEATWDRGIAEAFAVLLAALARGAATGAVGGGLGAGVGVGIGAVWSRIAAHSGPDAAAGVARLLRSSRLEGEAVAHLTGDADAVLVRAWQHLERGELAEAEHAIRALGLARGSEDLLLVAARAQHALAETSSLGRLPADADPIPRIVDDDAFAALTHGQRADAAVVIEAGRPQIVIRRSAPPSAIREELVHLHQFYGDPAMRARMLRLDEATLARWHELPEAERLGLHIDKLQVEADAQRRLLDHLEDAAAAGDPDAITRLHDAAETLARLDQRLVTAEGVRAGTLDPGLFDVSEAPRLYARGAQTAAPPAAAVPFQGRLADDAEVIAGLRRRGYEPHYDSSGRVFSFHRARGRTGELPHVTVDDTGRIQPATGRLSFAEQHAAAAGDWRLRQQDLADYRRVVAAGGDPVAATAAQAEIARLAPAWRTALADRVTAGSLDEGSAGLLAKWGPALEDLRSRTGGRLSLTDLLDTVPAGRLTEGQLSAFRGRLRDHTVAYLETIPDLRQRTGALHELLARQPDSASKGALFTDYRRAAMRHQLDDFDGELFDVPGDVVPFTGDDLARVRRADDVVAITGDRADFVPRGRYALEDKAGPGAFDLAQAQDYARRFDPTLPRRTPGDRGAATGGFRAGPSDAAAEHRWRPVFLRAARTPRARLTRCGMTS
ncbi:MAG: hypothetical protein R3B06_14655 [Kofleriaceae bacterium]